MTTLINTQAVQKHSNHRLELLLFYLGESKRRRFGINVLKVKEVIPCPPLNQFPGANPNILGVFNSRGITIPIIHLRQAIHSGGGYMDNEQMLKGSIITTEINRSTQGFWVTGIDKIIEIEWQDIKPPSKKKGTIGGYITGIATIEDELVQIIDIENVLVEVLGIEVAHDEVEIDDEVIERIRGKLILLVDDSAMAIKQTIRALEILGLEYIVAQDGKLALELIQNYDPDARPIDMIITDIEMPEMDGYTFVKELRKMPLYSNIHVLMHTSLNGEMNMQNAISAGANDVLTKFIPTELAEKVVSYLIDN